MEPVGAAVRLSEPELKAGDELPAGPRQPDAANRLKQKRTNAAAEQNFISITFHSIFENRFNFWAKPVRRYRRRITLFLTICFQIFFDIPIGTGKVAEFSVLCRIVF